MKKLFLSALVLLSTALHAGEINLLNKNLRSLDYFDSRINAKFVIDQNSNTARVNITVSDLDYIYTGNGYQDPWGNWSPGTTRIPIPRTVFESTIVVPGLTVLGDDLVLEGEEGSVTCGTMGVSRILRRPTLNLTGDCLLKATLEHNVGSTQALVTLKIK